LSLCHGPQSEIFSSTDILETARRAADLGVSALLVNCSPLPITADLVEQMKGLGPQVGCYANVGSPDEDNGWISEGEANPGAYRESAASWLTRGATILGGCCGTGPLHIKALSELLRET
jgi:S-methylmethionine-dependent homocysteine/selenocysteine methylase